MQDTREVRGRMVQSRKSICKEPGITERRGPVAEPRKGRHGGRELKIWSVGNRGDYLADEILVLGRCCQGFPSPL